MKPLSTLTKQQLFDLQFKYSELNPKYGSGKLIEDWWYNYHAWLNLCLNEKLPIDFIREFKDYLIWETVSYYQNLSEDIIREFKDCVIWKYILERQDISSEFIEEMRSEGYLK